MKTLIRIFLTISLLILTYALSKGDAIPPGEDDFKFPVPIECYVGPIPVSFGAKCVGAGWGCVPNPCDDDEGGEQ